MSSGYWQRFLTFEQRYHLQVDRDMNRVKTAFAGMTSAPAAGEAMVGAWGSTLFEFL
jgi:hypothetical protein